MTKSYCKLTQVPTALCCLITLSSFSENSFSIIRGGGQTSIRGRLDFLQSLLTVFPLLSQ